MRFLSFRLLLCFLYIMTTLPLAQAAPTVTVPEALFGEMVEAGLGEWHEIVAKKGAKVTLPRPMMCEGCGGGFYPDVANQDHLSCPTCSHPVTDNTRRFVTPKEVLPNGNLRIYLPKNLSVSEQPMTAVARALSARLAQFAELEMVACPSCSRWNNPAVFSNCYSCGTEIPREQVKPAARETVAVVGDEQMPARETVTEPARTTRPRTMRGSVQSTPTFGRAGTAPEVVEGPLRSVPRVPRIPRGVVAGGVATLAITGAAIGIGYMTTGDDVHVSRGTVEVVNENRVLIHVPGFMQPFVLTNDDSVEDDTLYEGSLLTQYKDADMVDVWWTRDDGVVQIIPLDFNMEEEG